MVLPDSVCIIIPTYNNEKTILSVVNSVMPYSQNIIVVNDGSTDTTPQLLLSVSNSIILISYKKNQGKGYALKQAFKEAKSRNFTVAITLDADGQHKATDLPLFEAEIAKNNETLIIGSRKFDLPNMPSKNSFANKFSFNFYLCSFNKPIFIIQQICINCFIYFN